MNTAEPDSVLFRRDCNFQFYALSFLSEYNDFLKEYPDLKMNFIASLDRIHDRYIAIDFETEKEKLYHCGASSKDAGRRITTITEIKGIADYKNTLESLLLNRELKLN